MKKLLCLVLAALMLFSATACVNSDSGTSTTANTNAATEAEQTTPPSTTGNESAQTPSTGETDTEPATEVETDGYTKPDVDGKGRTVTILYQKTSGKESELEVEMDGTVINDAVYTRNKVVEKELGITFAYVDESDATTLSSSLGNDISTSAKAYDLVVNASHVAVSAVLNGYYQNLSVLNNIDTSKYYWTQGYNDLATFTAEKKQYLASGSLALSMFRLMFVTIFNRDMMTAYGKDDLYSLVRSGDWTLDRQYEIITDMYDDRGGDGRTEDDTYGFITGDIVSMDPYMVAADLHMIIRSEEDNSLVFNEDIVGALSNLVDKIQLMVNDESTYVFSTSEKDDVGKDYIVEAFSLGHSLMATIMFWNMEHSMETLAEVNYGIIPIPKFSAEQEYHSYVQDQVSSFGISAGVGSADKELMAAVLESMAYHSYEIVRPQYYTNTLSTRFMQDEESAAMLDLIFDSLEFDFSQTCSGMVSSPALRDSLRPILSGSENKVASQVKSWKRSIPRSLKNVNSKIGKLE